MFIYLLSLSKKFSLYADNDKRCCDLSTSNSGHLVKVYPKCRTIKLLLLITSVFYPLILRDIR
jgi:hypothetical protein